MCQKREIKEAELMGDTAFEKQKAALVDLKSQNNKKLSDSKAYSIKVQLEALSETDPHVLQTLSLSGMSPSQLIASSFKELAEHSNKIGNLNISPDLLGQLLSEHEK